MTVIKKFVKNYETDNLKMEVNRENKRQLGNTELP